MYQRTDPLSLSFSPLKLSAVLGIASLAKATETSIPKRRLNVKRHTPWDFEAEATPKINPKIHGLNFVTVAER
jgi:hypothetical protein